MCLDHHTYIHIYIDYRIQIHTDILLIESKRIGSTRKKRN